MTATPLPSLAIGFVRSADESAVPAKFTVINAARGGLAISFPAAVALPSLASAIPRVSQEIPAKQWAQVMERE